MNDGAPNGADINRVILESSCDALGIAVLVCSRDDTILFASRTMLQYFPVPPEILMPGTRLRDFLGAVYDTGVRPGTVPESSRRRTNREDWIAEHMALHWRERYESIERAGRTRWVSMRKRRLSSGMGILSITDVSDQKKRDDQLQTDLERVELTEQILDAQPNPICVKDRNLNYIAVNKAFCLIHDLPQDAILGRSAWDLVESELAERFEQSDRMVLDTGKPHSQAEHIVRADGSDLWVLTRKYRVGMPGRHFVVTCMNDVTDIAVWYHGGEDAPAQAGLQISDYSIFAAAQNFYDPFRALNVQQLVEAGSMIETLPARGLRVLVATGDHMVEERLVARLRGSGLDACAVRDADELRAFGRVVDDAGIKLDVLLLDAAFPERQHVAGAWRNCPVLSVSAGQDGAAVLADVFRVCSERAPSPAMPEPDWTLSFEGEDIAAPLPAPQVDVLVAEDNQINQFVFTQILEGLGVSHRIAANGWEAVELWHELQPSLVLMDVSMPVMNGFDATVAIRAAEKPRNQKTPIIGVTAQALDIDLQQCKASGMDDHIMKPVSPDMIEAVLRKFMPAKAMRTTG
ncbi:response regulator [Ensifer sp. MJa1]|uniref:response regulator n=1 Tax=Ensifer sp. MJa1 TaxID=2919888 RepID=UPI00300B34A8